MTISVTPIFIIKVMVVGRRDPIESHAYDNRSAAEADLLVINDARQSKGEVQMPWLTLAGDRIDAAWIEDQSSAFGFVSLDVAPGFDDPY
jgi:hypothetical protein